MRLSPAYLLPLPVSLCATLALYPKVTLPPIPTIAPARAPINPTSFVLPLPSTLARIYDSTLNANGV